MGLALSGSRWNDGDGLTGDFDLGKTIICENDIVFFVVKFAEKAWVVSDEDVRGATTVNLEDVRDVPIGRVD